MNAFGTPRGSMLAESDASARLARLLDRAVMVARAGQILELAGRFVVAVTLSIVAVALGRGLGLRLTFPAGPLVVAAAIAIAAWQGSRRWKWSDRLATAMALERAHPRIGERISRAVAFIGMPPEQPGSPTDLPVRELVREALDEAAMVLKELAEDRSSERHPIRGPLVPLRWPAAGLAAAAAVVIVALVAPGRLVPPLAEAFFMPRSAGPVLQPSQSEPASVLPNEAVAAAGRLAEAVVTEERLATAVLARFAASPGASREELARGEQEWLDETAALQAAIADDIGRDLATVVAAVARTDPRLAAELAGGGLVRERTARLQWAAERIRENQLAAASGLITSQVRPILAALRACGVVPSGQTGPALDRAGLVQRRILAAIEADGDRPPGAVDAAGSVPQGGTIDQLPTDEAGRTPDVSAAATVTADRAGPAAGGTTGDVGGSPAAAAAPPGDAVVTDRGGRLPAWVRARDERTVESLVGDTFSAPPRYREAVDDYYRRLWAAESTGPVERGEHREQEAGP